MGLKLMAAKKNYQVFKFEIEFLKNNGKNELAKKVEIVSENYALGYDILSFELDGTEKQIEVKTIKKKGKEISFYLTANELSKSELYSNYYLYCVENPKADDFKISIIKNPQFNNEDLFVLEPQSFVVKCNGL